MDKINEHKLWIIEINFSKLHQFHITYTYRRHNNRFKLFMICVYLPIHYSLTENNTTYLGVRLTGRFKIKTLCAACS